MHDGNCGLHLGVLQIRVVLPHLIGKQQPLVNHGAGAHRGHEIFPPVSEVECLDAVRSRLTDHVELSFKSILHHNVRSAPDKDLTDDGRAFADGLAHAHRVIDRHIAPAENNLPLAAHCSFKLLLAGSS